MSDAVASNKLKESLSSGTNVLENISDVIDHLKARQSDIYLSAISSFDCIELTILAAESGNKLLLANKESLVVYGEHLVNISNRSGTKIVPIDSEHYSLMNSLNNIQKNDIDLSLIHI